MTRSLPRRLTLSLWLLMLAIVLLLASFAVARPAHAANFSAGTYTELVDAINQANTLAGDDTISITADITLTGLLPDIISNITFEGNNHKIDADNKFVIFFVCNCGTATINNLTLTNGYGVDVIPGFIAAGGAIFNNGGTVNISHSSLTNSQIIFTNKDAAISAGGAIFSAGGVVNVTDSTFTNNVVAVNATNITDSGIRISAGGAITSLGGLVSISNSTFSGNQAAVTGTGFSISLGGAIANAGLLHVENSTFFNNTASATGGGLSAGGAIGNLLGSAEIINVTFSNNTASATGGGTSGGWSIANIIGQVYLVNSILSDPIGGNNCVGTITDAGFNVQFPDNSCGASIPVVDPKLDPSGLKNNGGPTQTIALQANSPAINRIPLADCPSTDQRHFGRQGLCDIGAYEFSANGPEEPADLIGQLRESPDRVAANDAENVISYTFTVKNVGKGVAGATSLTLPIDPQLVIGYTQFNDPRLWVSALTTDSVRVGLPLLANNDVVSGTIFFRPNPAAAPAAGTKVSSRYTLKWTNPAGDDKLVWSNAVSFDFGGPGSNLDVSGGQVQLMTSGGPVANSTKTIYHSNFWIPNEIVTAWLTRPDGTSVALSEGRANDQGEYTIEVDTSGLAAGSYVVAAFGQHSEEYGSAGLEVGASGSSQAKPATNLGLKALGAKALVAPKSR